MLPGALLVSDEVDGVMSIFVETDPVAYFVLMKDDYTKVHLVSSPDEGDDIANYLNESRKFR